MSLLVDPSDEEVTELVLDTIETFIPEFKNYDSAFCGFVPVVLDLLLKICYNRPF